MDDFDSLETFLTKILDAIHKVDIIVDEKLNDVFREVLRAFGVKHGDDLPLADKFAKNHAYVVNLAIEHAINNI